MAQPRSYAIAGPAGDLAVHDWGGDGAPTLLAHPTGFHGLLWAPVAARLVAAGRRVWSFDFRGHGDSAAPEPDGDTYSWGSFATDALAVVDHLGVGGDPAFVACGHSKGAAALLLGEAERAGTYPRIWAYEPIIFPSSAAAPVEDFPLARSARRRRNEWSSVEEVYDAYASKPPLDVMTPESLRAYVEYGVRDRGDGVLELKCRPEVEARVYTMGPLNGAWDVLPAVQSIVTVACGERSTDIGPPLAARIVERLAHGRVEVWVGRGHFGPQEDPDRCTASILSLAGSQSPP
jgi:pimeloyl-ACP methyl ester carboxylesterase